MWRWHVLLCILIHLLILLLRPLLQEAILDIKRIRVCYLRTWFIPDVIAAFPIGYILLFAVIIRRACRGSGEPPEFVKTNYALSLFWVYY